MPEQGGHIIDALGKLLNWMATPRLPDRNIWKMPPSIHDPGEMDAAVNTAMDFGPMSGVIRTMAGKEFPNALALRTMNMEELPFLRQLLRTGKPHDVSTSIVSPAQVGSWQDFGNQYGALFDINNPRAIKAISPSDLHAGFQDLEPTARRSRKALVSINPSHSEALNFTDSPLPQNPWETGPFSWPSQRNQLGDWNPDSFIKNSSNLYNEAVLGLGTDTPISGIRILPKTSSFYDPSQELNAVSEARSLGVPIYNIPGADQLNNQFPRLLEMIQKYGAGSRWTKHKGQYQGTSDIELRSPLWKDLYGE